MLAEYFCLRTNDVARLVRGLSPNENDCRSTHHTLGLLFKENLLNRLPYLDLDQVNGGLSYVYGLSDKGCRLNATELFLWDNGKTFDEHSQRTLDHELEISFFHIALKEFCKRNGFKLYWQQADLKCGIHPDAYFAITDPTKPENKNTFHYFLEMERSKLAKYVNGEPQIMQMLGKYYDYYDTDKCEKEWNFRRYRVIVVQRSEERRENLLRAMHEKYPHRMFWMTTEELYKRNIEGVIFRTPKDFGGMNYSFLSQ